MILTSLLCNRELSCNWLLLDSQLVFAGVHDECFG